MTFTHFSQLKYMMKIRYYIHNGMTFHKENYVM